MKQRNKATLILALILCFDCVTAEVVLENARMRRSPQGLAGPPGLPGPKGYASQPSYPSGNSQANGQPGIFDKIPTLECQYRSECRSSDGKFPTQSSTQTSTNRSCPQGFRASASGRFCSKCTSRALGSNEECPAGCSVSRNFCVCCVTQPL